MLESRELLMRVGVITVGLLISLLGLLGLIYIRKFTRMLDNLAAHSKLFRSPFMLGGSYSSRLSTVNYVIIFSILTCFGIFLALTVVIWHS